MTTPREQEKIRRCKTRVWLTARPGIGQQWWISLASPKYISKAQHEYLRSHVTTAFGLAHFTRAFRSAFDSVKHRTWCFWTIWKDFGHLAVWLRNAPRLELLPTSCDSTTRYSYTRTFLHLPTSLASPIDHEMRPHREGG